MLNGRSAPGAAVTLLGSPATIAWRPDGAIKP